MAAVNCNQCGYMFSSSGALASHVRRSKMKCAPSDKHRVCKICCVSFGDAKAFAKHKGSPCTAPVIDWRSTCDARNLIVVNAKLLEAQQKIAALQDEINARSRPLAGLDDYDVRYDDTQHVFG